MEAISLRMRDFDNRMSAATKPKITMNTTATIEYWTVRRRPSRITGKFCQITFISLVLFRCFDIYNNIRHKKRAAQQSALRVFIPVGRVGVSGWLVFYSNIGGRFDPLDFTVGIAVEVFIEQFVIGAVFLDFCQAVVDFLQEFRFFFGYRDSVVFAG